MSILTNVGRSILTNRIKGAGTEPAYNAWGTGTTAEAVTQTALVTPSAEARVAGTTTQQTTTVTNDTYQNVGTITSAGTQTITEHGLFDALTVGNMFCRSVFTGIAVVAADQITFTTKVVFL